MHEKITKLTPSTKERPKPKRSADVVDIETARKRRQEKASNLLRDNMPTSPDTTIEQDELLKTVFGLVEKIFKESGNKNKVLDQLRELGNKLESELNK